MYGAQPVGALLAVAAISFLGKCQTARIGVPGGPGDLGIKRAVCDGRPATWNLEAGMAAALWAAPLSAISGGVATIITEAMTFWLAPG